MDHYGHSLVEHSLVNLMPWLHSGYLKTRFWCVQVVLAPIVEPPSQTGITTGFYETPLYATLSEAFGYMNDAGYCATGSICKNFPIILEIGSPLVSLDDQLMMESLANYMTLNGLGKLTKANAREAIACACP